MVSTKKNKVSPNTDVRTVLKLVSRTSLPVLLEDVRQASWLNKILESRYDEDQVIASTPPPHPHPHPFTVALFRWW